MFLASLSCKFARSLNTRLHEWVAFCLLFESIIRVHRLFLVEEENEKINKHLK